MLIADDEGTVVDRVRPWLESDGFQVVGVRTSDHAIRATHMNAIALAVIDYRLADGEDGIRLGQLLRTRFDLEFILVSGVLTPPVAFDAAVAGAAGVMAKPFTREQLLSSIDRVLRGDIGESRFDTSVAAEPEGVGSGALGGLAGSTPQRWSRMVLGACKSDVDPSRTELWGRAVGMSVSSIRDICKVCGVPCHDSRDLGRFLRALSKNRSGQIPLRSYFDAADERTLKRLFQRAGIPIASHNVYLREFLHNQHFVSTTVACLMELCQLASNSDFFK